MGEFDLGKVFENFSKIKENFMKPTSKRVISTVNHLFDVNIS